MPTWTPTTGKLVIPIHNNLGIGRSLSSYNIWRNIHNTNARWNAWSSYGLVIVENISVMCGEWMVMTVSCVVGGWSWQCHVWWVDGHDSVMCRWVGVMLGGCVAGSSIIRVAFVQMTNIVSSQYLHSGAKSKVWYYWWSYNTVGARQSVDKCAVEKDDDWYTWVGLEEWLLIRSGSVAPQSKHGCMMGQSKKPHQRWVGNWWLWIITFKNILYYISRKKMWSSMHSQVLSHRIWFKPIFGDKPYTFLTYYTILSSRVFALLQTFASVIIMQWSHLEWLQMIYNLGKWQSVSRTSHN